MGRYTLKHEIQRYIGEANIWPWINTHLGNVKNTKDGMATLSKTTSEKVTATVAPFRSLITAGIKAGRIPKGSGLYLTIKEEQRGRRPKNVEAIAEVAPVQGD